MISSSLVCTLCKHLRLAFEMFSYEYPVLLSLLSLSLLASAAPVTSPETVGADADCFTPVITVTSATKLKQGPWLVSGARADANPNGKYFIFWLAFKY